MTKAEEGPEVTGVELKWLHWLLDQHWPYLKKAMEKVVKKELGFAVCKVILDDFGLEEVPRRCFWRIWSPSSRRRCRRP